MVQVYHFDSTTGEGEFIEEDAIPDPVADVIVPASISPLQFWTQAALAAIISPTEALAVIQSKVLPAIMENFLAEIEDDTQRIFVKMKILGASEFRRHDEIAMQFASYLGMSDVQLDSFWVSANAIS